MSAWDQYQPMLTNTFDPDSNAYATDPKKQAIGVAGGIYDKKGTPYT